MLTEWPRPQQRGQTRLPNRFRRDSRGFTTAAMLAKRVRIVGRIRPDIKQIENRGSFPLSVRTDSRSAETGARTALSARILLMPETRGTAVRAPLLLPIRRPRIPSHAIKIKTEHNKRK